MDCRDVRDVSDAFLSGQLRAEAAREVVQHLDTCPQCAAEISDRRAMRSALRSAWAHAETLAPRPDFAAELTGRLRPAAGVAAATPVSRRSLLQSWLAVAAGLVLAAGGTWFVRDSRSRSRLASLASTAAGDHQNCAISFNLAERPIPLTVAGERYGEPYVALATFQVPPLDTALEPVASHACVYDGQRFGHIVFRARDVVVSLLVTDGAAPAAPELVQRDAGPAVASLPAGRFVAFLVADLDRDQVLNLARGLTDPLSRHLA